MRVDNFESSAPRNFAPSVPISLFLNKKMKFNILSICNWYNHKQTLKDISIIIKQSDVDCAIERSFFLNLSK